MGAVLTQQKDHRSQFDRFFETARALGCDEDKEKFEAQLGKIADHKPAAGTKPETKKERPGEKPNRSGSDERSPN